MRRFSKIVLMLPGDPSVLYPRYPRSADFMEMANQPIGQFQDILRAELKKVNQFACVS